MPDQPTCGQGLAEHSATPAKLGELIDAVAGNLEAHMKALDRTDPDAEKEYAAYRALAHRHREIASRLGALGDEMASYRDLPMGRHDEEALSSPLAVAAFENLVKVEQELLVLLQQRAHDHRTMLDGVGGARE
jgi:hypothetical protein